MAAPSALVVSPSHLMHASLAYLSPELVVLDRITALRACNALKTDSHASAALGSLPTELLLEIRSHLVGLVTDDAKSATLAALDAHESAVLDSLCQDCVAYNRGVFGNDPWGWSNYSGGCDCARGGVASPLARDRAAHVVAYADKHAWLEAHLSKLSPEGKPIWDAVSGVLRDFGCRLESRSKTSALVVPVASAVLDQQVSLWRAESVLDLTSDDGCLDCILSDIPSPSPSNSVPAHSAKPAAPVEAHPTPTVPAGRLSAMLAPIAFMREAAGREPALLAAFASAVALRFILA